MQSIQSRFGIEITDPEHPYFGRWRLDNIHVWNHKDFDTNEYICDCKTYHTTNKIDNPISFTRRGDKPHELSSRNEDFDIIYTTQWKEILMDSNEPDRPIK